MPKRNFAELMLENEAERVCLANKNVGMRFTPLHHRSTPTCVRIVTIDVHALKLVAKEFASEGWNVAGPFIKLDGLRYIEIYAK